MRDFAIMTDSCCDLTEAEVAESELRVVPLRFTIGGESFRDTPDHADMSLSTFYGRLRAGEQSVTAAANVADFSDAMRAVLDEEKDVLCVLFSSALSTTYQSACIAAGELRGEYPEAKIIVIDSLSASRGQGMLVWGAARQKKQGHNIDKVADWVRSMIPHQDHWFTVDDLNHLRRGGRLNATSAVVGTVLAIKPVMHCDDEGKLTPVGKARGMKRAVEELANKLEELCDRPLWHQTVFICHADAPETAQMLRNALLDRFGISDVRVGYIGPVIGSHTGAGTVGVFFYGSRR